MDRDFKIEEGNPLVSITMPAYNCADYVRAAIQSVIAQTYQKWELIIIDDASTDMTADMIASIHDPRITLIHHTENLGITKTRNEALLMCRGTYVAVLDSDDTWIDPRKLEKQIAFLETEKAYALLGTNITLLNASGIMIGNTAYESDDASIRTHLLLKNQFAHSSVVMRKYMLDQAGNYYDGLAEDLDLFLSLGSYGKFANLDTFMTGYRIHGKNMSTKRKEMARAVHNIIMRYKDKYPNAELALIKSYLRMLRAHLPL